MATSAPSSARARADAAPMPREPPITRAILPESFLVMGFLRSVNCDGPWICRPLWYRNRNYRNTLFLFLSGAPNGKTSGLRGAGDFREGRGAAFLCRGGERTFAVEGDRVQGG